MRDDIFALTHYESAQIRNDLLFMGDHVDCVHGWQAMAASMDPENTYSHYVCVDHGERLWSQAKEGAMRGVDLR